MNQRIVVSGMGIISAIGNDLSENWHNLYQQESGIGLAKHFQSVYASTLPFGEIDASNDALKSWVQWNSEKAISRTTLIALKAFQEAVSAAELSNEEIKSKRTAFISASTVGGMCETDSLYQDANLVGSPSSFINTYEGSNHTFEIARLYGIRGYVDTINTACSSASNAILLGAKLIASGRVDRAIVGGVDCLSKFTVNGFNSLRILSENVCKPFDGSRDGLNLGEGAAYLVLEKESEAKHKHAVLSGFGNANDAFHPSATSDEAFGPCLTMQLALEMAQLEPSSIDYINAHGTGTPNNDVTETFALEKIFQQVPPFASTKSYTGHTLAAAGALEAVYSILCLKHNWCAPTLNWETPMESYTSRTLTTGLDKKLEHVLSNSFGFGGNCTSLIFSACI